MSKGEIKGIYINELNEPIDKFVDKINKGLVVNLMSIIKSRKIKPPMIGAGGTYGETKSSEK